MTTRSVWLRWMAGLLLLVGSVCGAQAPKAAKDGSSARAPKAAAGEMEDLTASITFRFEILDLLTDHQFPGQKNSFHVEYQYAGVLEGADFDPQGHAVRATTYPYFQSVRKTILDYIAKYPDKHDFYEVFGMNICRRVMREFPQIRKITLRIDTPAFGPVNVDRGETIVVERKAGRKK